MAKKPNASGRKRDGDDVQEPERISQASDIVALVLGTGIELFRSSDGASDCFATVPWQKGRDTMRITSEQFENTVGGIYFRARRCVANKAAIGDALTTLRGIALFNGPVLPVFTRLAEVDDAIYLDMCDDQRRAIRVTAKRWDIVKSPSARFLRPSGMLAMPAPVRGGSVKELRRFVNIADEDWPLFLAWCVNALQTIRPMPVLVIQGEKGSAKSTLCRLTRMLIDPNRAPLRSAPRNEQDLLIAATNGAMIALENISWISQWLSDAICRISTGAALGTRRLYSDAEETLLSVKRPVMVNGITSLVTRSDLLDRCIFIHLEPISPRNRRPERELLAEFETARPRILGGLLDAVSAAIRNELAVSLKELPRMADAFRFSVAAEPALRLEQGEIIKAFTANRKRAAASAIDSCIVAQPVIDFMKNKPSWTGTATALLMQLQLSTDGRVSANRAWPRLPQYLSNQLRRIAPDLREHGIEVHFDRNADSRQITLKNMHLLGPSGPRIARRRAK